MSTDPDPARPANRLARESSPYLLQHAHNPVDWYPWGEEAFARARAEDKPILLSVGYATCHWCHVMERESFEDPAIARQLRDGFIAIKVDREELPDVDHVYMSALQALTGRGGWPMNMILTPTLQPFYGGTYFPPQPRHGLPSFAQVLEAVREAWLQRRAAVEERAAELIAHLRGGAGGTGGTASGPSPAASAAARLLETLGAGFDPAHGGFGDAPKFPQAPLLQCLLALAAGGDERARGMLLRTLRGMADGGLYDHVGGGFARYSTDARWHVPHFEKMLYDNAQLARVYAGAARLTGDRRLRFIAEDTLAWLLREMRPAAAPATFSAALDADSEGVEGRYYVWTRGELDAVLGADAEAAARLYGATRDGNWEHGVNVLARWDAAAVQASLGLADAAFDAWEASVRDRLRSARARRTRPLTDDKVLADWNGLALRAFAETGRLFGVAAFVETAAGAARFLLETMRADGRLRHAWREGRLRAESYLADAAQVGLGLLELHAASGDPRWLLAARDLGDELVLHHFVPGDGLYDGEQGPLPLRAREIQDGASPSGTAAACELLLRLAGVFDRADWFDIAAQTLARESALLSQAPVVVPALLFAQQLSEHGADLALPAPAGPLDELRATFAPRVTFVSGAPDSVPVLAGRTPGAAYLCRFGACGLPARTLDEARAQLQAMGAG